MEQKTRRYEFDTNQAYKLISVTDHQGNDKVCSHGFYEERLNCAAVDFRYDDSPSYGDKYRLNMMFVQNEDGLLSREKENELFPINRIMRIMKKNMENDRCIF